MGLPSPNNYVEIQNGAYYVAGSAVSLASVIHLFRQGASPETILQDFPRIGSLARVYGAIAFVLENQALVDAYLADQKNLWSGLESEYPLPPEMLARFEKGRERLKRQPARGRHPHMTEEGMGFP